MKASLDYSEITKLIKQSTNTDVDIKFIKDKENCPIQVTATIDLPIIGTHTITVNVHLVYKEKYLYVFYDIGFLYKALLPKVIKYIADKGFGKYFEWVDSKKLFIINLQEIETCKQVLDFVTINNVEFGPEIFAEFDVNVNNGK